MTVAETLDAPAIEPFITIDALPTERWPKPQSSIDTGAWFFEDATRGMLNLVDGGTFTAWAMTAMLLAAILVEGSRLLPRSHRWTLRFRSR